LCDHTAFEARVGEKVADDPEALGWLLPKCHVAARADGDPSRSLEAVKQRGNVVIWYFIVSATENECRAGDSALISG